MSKNFVTEADFKDTNIMKSFGTDEIFKAHKGTKHIKHKYISIDADGNYVYDHSKMNSKDHFAASDFHIAERRKAEPASEAHVQHTKLAEEHEALGWKKEGAERKAIKLGGDKKLGEKVAKKDKTFDEDVREFLDSQKGKGPAEVHKNLAKEFGMNESLTKHYIKKYLASPVNDDIKKSEAFDALIPTDFEDRIQKADFSTKKREKLADEHEAMPDGSYPIRNESDLKNAIQAYGRSKDKAKTMAWIKKRAKELNAEKHLPEKWEE